MSLSLKQRSEAFAYSDEPLASGVEDEPLDTVPLRLRGFSRRVENAAHKRVQQRLDELRDALAVQNSDLNANGVFDARNLAALGVRPSQPDTNDALFNHGGVDARTGRLHAFERVRLLELDEQLELWTSAQLERRAKYWCRVIRGSVWLFFELARLRFASNLMWAAFEQLVALPLKARIQSELDDGALSLNDIAVSEDEVKEAGARFFAFLLAEFRHERNVDHDQKTQLAYWLRHYSNEAMQLTIVHEFESTPHAGLTADDVRDLVARYLDETRTVDETTKRRFGGCVLLSQQALKHYFNEWLKTQVQAAMLRIDVEALSNATEPVLMTAFPAATPLEAFEVAPFGGTSFSDFLVRLRQAVDDDEPDADVVQDSVEVLRDERIESTLAELVDALKTSDARLADFERARQLAVQRRFLIRRWSGLVELQRSEWLSMLPLGESERDLVRMEARRRDAAATLFWASRLSDPRRSGSLENVLARLYTGWSGFMPLRGRDNILHAIERARDELRRLSGTIEVPLEATLHARGDDDSLSCRLSIEADYTESEFAELSLKPRVVHRFALHRRALNSGLVEVVSTQDVAWPNLSTSWLVYESGVYWAVAERRVDDVVEVGGRESWLAVVHKLEFCMRSETTFDADAPPLVTWRTSSLPALPSNVRAEMPLSCTHSTRRTSYDAFLKAFCAALCALGSDDAPVQRSDLSWYFDRHFRFVQRDDDDDWTETLNAAINAAPCARSDFLTPFAPLWLNIHLMNELAEWPVPSSEGRVENDHIVVRLGTALARARGAALVVESDDEATRLADAQARLAVLRLNARVLAEAYNRLDDLLIDEALDGDFLDETVNEALTALDRLSLTAGTEGACSDAAWHAKQAQKHRDVSARELAAERLLRRLHSEPLSSLRLSLLHSDFAVRKQRRVEVTELLNILSCVDVLQPERELRTNATLWRGRACTSTRQPDASSITLRFHTQLPIGASRLIPTRVEAVLERGSRRDDDAAEDALWRSIEHANAELLGAAEAAYSASYPKTLIFKTNLSPDRLGDVRLKFSCLQTLEQGEAFVRTMRLDETSNVEVAFVRECFLSLLSELEALARYHSSSALAFC